MTEKGIRFAAGPVEPAASGKGEMTIVPKQSFPWYKRSFIGGEEYTIDRVQGKQLVDAGLATEKKPTLKEASKSMAGSEDGSGTKISTPENPKVGDPGKTKNIVTPEDPKGKGSGKGGKKGNRPGSAPPYNRRDMRAE